MATKQIMTQANTQAAKATIMVVRGRESVNVARSLQIMPKRGGLALKQPTFNWKAENKYHELWNFKIEVKVFLMTNSCNIQYNEKVPIIFIWLGREGLQFMQVLYDEKQERFKTSMGLFEVLSEEIKSQHNETVLSLQYCKLIWEQMRMLQNG